jgi:DNA-binding LacI/PurR family transcriptional regulator/EAL domain-containing protein (putative c-di-GMP-specific phosphodiesterase class I)
MDHRKRIALFVGQADEAYQSRFISGFLKNAFAGGYDVCIFSMYRKYQDTPEREQAESNIFSLMNPESFDGAVILKDSIQTENAAEKLELRLKESFKGAIVVIEKESELFPSICTDCYSAVFELVTHLIEVHGCRDIAFLCGKKWHKHSKERLDAFRDAMEKAGLPVSEERIIYGDFWYQSGEMCAEELLDSGKKLPDAVACANDQMAIGLCKAFEEHGIRVPEDIAVVGYDSTFEGQTSPSPITSALIPAEEFGEYAFGFLMDRMNGKVPESFKLRSKLLIGSSCGCESGNMPDYKIQRNRWGTDISEEGYDSVFNTMSENLLSQTTLQDFIGTVYSYAYQLSGAEEFHLCIAGNWKNTTQNTHVKNSGYPKEMIHAIRYCSDRKGNIAGTDEVFDTAEMLPELSEERSRPAAYFFTPLFFDNECFGYAAISYGDALRSYDETYRRWTGTVCRGFEVLRRSLVMNSMQEKLEHFHSSKFAVNDRAYESLGEAEQTQYRLVSKILDENLLDYYFQPIVSAVDGSVYAYEALMRSRTETKVSPLSIIKYATMQERLSDVERATFLNVLGYIDQHEENFGEARVFINSIPGVSVGEEAAYQLDGFLAAHAERVVVELTEEAELKDSELQTLKDYFSKMHIDIAVDDYGTGYSNVSNLLRYMPDFVKIDRALLSDIHEYPQKQHFVREIIDFCHDNGIKALAEGVETAEELQTVIHLGADLIQGFYTARPSADVVCQIDEKCRSQIKQFHQERIDGNNKHIYAAGKTNRVPLAKLEKSGFTDIVIGYDEMLYKDISIIGTPQMKTNLHMRVEPNYRGRITLEDVWFSNVKNRPCIELGENTSVTLVLVGTSTLMDSGIQVPESSRLVIEGDGSVNIELNAPESYGIGNNHHSRHGELVFEHDGQVNISCRGKNTVCIGSGLGGNIHINRGEYNLRINTEMAVGIGALTGEADLKITTCHIGSDWAASVGTFIGSLENNANIFIEKSSVELSAHSKECVTFGTLRGAESSIRTDQVSLEVSSMADSSTCFGALSGSSDIDLKDTHLKLDSIGQEVLAFGGCNKDTRLRVTDSDMSIVISSALGKETTASDENICFRNVRFRLKINGENVERDVKTEYSAIN